MSRFATCIVLAAVGADSYVIANRFAKFCRIANEHSTVFNRVRQTVTGEIVFMTAVNPTNVEIAVEK